MNKPILIFGREPAAWIGLIEAALVLALAFFHFMTAAQMGLVMAVVTAAFGCYTAYATHETMLGVIVGLSKSVIALAVGFGLHLTDVQTAAIMGFVFLTASFFNRSQTSPIVPITAIPTSWTPPAGGSYTQTQVGAAGGTTTWGSPATPTNGTASTPPVT